MQTIFGPLCVSNFVDPEDLVEGLEIGLGDFGYEDEEESPSKDFNRDVCLKCVSL